MTSLETCPRLRGSESPRPWPSGRSHLTSFCLWVSGLCPPRAIGPGPILSVREAPGPCPWSHGRLPVTTSSNYLISQSYNRLKKIRWLEHYIQDKWFISLMTLSHKLRGIWLSEDAKCSVTYSFVKDLLGLLE